MTWLEILVVTSPADKPQSDTPRTDALRDKADKASVGERHFKMLGEALDSHDELERALALALAHVERDTGEIERLHGELAEAKAKLTGRWMKATRSPYDASHNGMKEYPGDAPVSARQKLTDSQVRWLRKMAARQHPDGTRPTYASLAKCVGCSAQHVRDIVYGLRRVDRGKAK